MSTKPPRASGIYQIVCLPTGKFYVGSAVDLRARWDGHRSSLKRHDHGNQYLQAAWDEYGEANFRFEVLELVPEHDLLKAEQRWIDGTQCAQRSIGFNILAIAGPPRDAFAQTWEGFVDPDGNEVTIHNLAEFCRQHNLNANTMLTLANPKHKLKAHRGWTHKNCPRKRDYIKTWEGFIDPVGNTVEPITNLAEFCRERGLDTTHMVAVANGRICSHRGWTHIKGRAAEEDKTYYGFIDPKGQRVVIKGLPAFCRENGLKQVRMYNLISGVRNVHKGWTWREFDDQESQS